MIAIYFYNHNHILLFLIAQTSSNSDLTMVEVHVADSAHGQSQPVTVNFHLETKESKVPQERLSSQLLIIIVFSLP